MNFILKFYKKLKRKFNIFLWLNIKKGHKKFYNKENIHKIRAIKSDFYSDKIELKISKYNKNFYFEDNHLNSKIVRQKFVSKLSGNKFLYPLYFFSNKNMKGIYCLPKPYLDYLSTKHNVKINFFLSNIFFFLFIILNFFQGFKKFILITKHLLFINNLKCYDNKTSYDLFYNFNFKNFNINSKNFSTKKINIVNWIIKNFKTKNLILHGSDDFEFKDENINLSSNKNFFDIVLNSREVRKIFKTLLSLVFSIFLDLIFLRWWNVIFFSDACDFVIFKNSKSNLAKRYFFLYTSNPYKPLWTYAAEDNGSEIVLLTISVQTEIRNPIIKFNYDYEGIYSSTWKNYLVWNENHKNYILDKLSNKNVKFKVINSHVNYKDSDIKLVLPKNSVSVFSYDNHRFNLSHSTLADWSLSYKGDWHYLTKKFWTDIILMMKKFNFHIITKKKRDLPDKYLFKKDIKFHDNLSKLDNVINIDSDVAIERIVKETNLTISLPFTSASVVAKNLDRKAIYYDPISYIQKNDPNRSNVEIISGITELEQYFRNNLYLY